MHNRPEPQEPTPPPIRRVHQEANKGPNIGRILLGLVVVIVGAVLFGQKTNWYRENLTDVLNYWTLLVVFIGFSFVVGRRFFGVLLVVFLGTLVFLLLGLMLFGNFRVT